MIQPNELKLPLPISLSNGAVSSTTKLWEVLSASYKGDLPQVKALVDEYPELIYAQYNYTPPIHFAVREGHVELVKYLLDKGAHNPAYKTYPFSDNLQTIAQERGYNEIALLLEQYANNPDQQHYYKGDNGEIHYARTALQREFENAVDENNIAKTTAMLELHPEFALHETYFWGEGILMMPAKANHQQMIRLLMRYGAKVPAILKWTQFYYFEHDEAAVFMMENGMDPNTMSWHAVTILHDMAQKANVAKAELLLKYGANINSVEEEYQSTPLSIATRWGHIAIVEYLLQKGADVNKAGAIWATPLAWAKKKKHADIEKLLIDNGAV